MVARRIHLSDESGFGLIEVVISSVVLLLVTMGTLSLMDGAAKSTVQNRARTAAASLAEQDQDALRAKAALTLAGSAATGRQGYTNSYSAPVGGVTYSVTSTATWVRDSSGATPSCTDPDGIAEYLRLTSTVSAPLSSTTVRPVTLTSLLAPTFGSFGKHTGTLTIELKDRSGTGLPGVPVTVTGPQNATQSTNAAGCAIFNYFPSGNYNATWSRAGFVDKDGVTNPTATATVSDAATTRISRQFDNAGALTMNIRSKTGATTIASTTSEVTLANAKMTASRVFPTVTGGGSIQTGSTLFPFTDGYTIYTGDCSANNPTGYGGTPAIVSSLAAGAVLSPTSSPVAPEVFQPTVTATLQKNGTAQSGLEIVFTPTTADQGLGCATKYRFNSGTGGAVAAGLPYGNYNYCVDDGSTGSARSFRPSTVVANTVLTGRALGNLNIPSSGYVSGACP